MTRPVVLALLLLPLLAVAAPVPKKKPAFGQFGDFTDPKTKCKAELKDGSLTVTVPTEQPAVDAAEMKPLQPTVATTVEGDFEVMVRVRQTLPLNPETALKKKQTVAVASGLSVYAEGSTELGMMVVIEREKWPSHWATMLLCAERDADSGGYLQTGSGAEEDTPVYLRLTRRRNEVVAESSIDAKEWRYVRGQKLKGLTDRVTVGPVAFQSTDKEFNATFDEYELKPLEKKEKK